MSYTCVYYVKSVKTLAKQFFQLISYTNVQQICPCSLIMFWKSWNEDEASKQVLGCSFEIVITEVPRFSLNVDIFMSNWFPLCSASESDPCIVFISNVFVFFIVNGKNSKSVSSRTEIWKINASQMLLITLLTKLESSTQCGG